MTVRAGLRFVEQVLPSRTPIRSWEAFWEYVEGLPQRRGRLVPRPTGHNPEVRAHARVDEGRWIADCPWGCGAAFNLPQAAAEFWCTECAGGGFGLTAVLVWPGELEKLTVNLESLPAALQFWPCLGCRNGVGVCDKCRRMQGQEV